MTMGANSRVFTTLGAIRDAFELENCDPYNENRGAVMDARISIYTMTDVDSYRSRGGAFQVEEKVVPKFRFGFQGSLLVQGSENGKADSVIRSYGIWAFKKRRDDGRYSEGFYGQFDIDSPFEFVNEILNPLRRIRVPFLKANLLNYGEGAEIIVSPPLSFII